MKLLLKFKCLKPMVYCYFKIHSKKERERQCSLAHLRQGKGGVERPYYPSLELHNAYVRVCEVSSVMSDSLKPHQTPLSMGFPRQEYWSGLPCPPPGDLLHPEIEPTSLTSALAGGFFTTSATWEAYTMHLCPVFLPSPSVCPVDQYKDQNWGWARNFTR